MKFAVGASLLVLLSVGACGQSKKPSADGAAGMDGSVDQKETGGAGKDAAAGKDASDAKDGADAKDAAVDLAADGDAAADAPADLAEETGVDAGDDGDAPFVPEIPPAICPPMPDGGTDAAAEGPSGPDNVMFLGTATVSTLAGMGTSGAMNGTAAEATFSNPVSIAIDPAGDLVVCDFENDAVRLISMPTGAVTVTTLTKQQGFTRPYGIAFDKSGNLYVDTDYNPTGGKNIATGTIWKIDRATGVASVVLDNIGRPRGIAALSDGRLVLGDYQNNRVRLLDPGHAPAGGGDSDGGDSDGGASDGGAADGGAADGGAADGGEPDAGQPASVTDFAGLYGCPGMADGKGTAARFTIPYGVGVLPDGRILVADENNHRIRAITMAGDVSTFAGDGGDGTVDGPRLQARFSHPTALAIDAAGDVFVADYAAHRIRRIAADGTVRTVAGDGTKGFMDGAGASAQFYGIEGIAVTPDGKTLYVADGNLGEGAASPYNRIRVITVAP